MWSGYRVPGAELFRLGVVEACVPPDRLMETAKSLARDIASKSPVAIRLANQALNTIEEMSIRDGYRYEQKMTVELGGHPESKEAMLVFSAQRAPRIAGD